MAQMVSVLECKASVLRSTHSSDKLIRVHYMDGHHALTIVDCEGTLIEQINEIRQVSMLPLNINTHSRIISILLQGSSFTIGINSHSLAHSFISSK